jgi:cytochrome P450
MAEPRCPVAHDEARPVRLSEHFREYRYEVLDQKQPQPRYRQILERGGYLEFEPNLHMAFDRHVVEFILRNPDAFSNFIEMEIGNERPLLPLNLDPPRHTAYRKLLDPMFGPKRMAAQEEDIARRVNALIDGFIDRGECDFTAEFAEIFPSSVFLGLCGLPEEELHMFLRMRDGVMHPERIDPSVTTDPKRRLELNTETGRQIYAYFGDLIDRRAAEPRSDMISGLLAHEIDGQRLSKADILDLCFNFVVAGLDTVSGALTCFWAFLAQNDGHRRQIVEDPALIPAVVEELLRWESPIQAGIPRVATRDVELPNGKLVKAGTAIFVCFGSSNVSDETMDDPMVVRFDRGTNPHLAFAGGAHRCLGSHLARRELRIALSEWHRRIPNYRLKVGHEDLKYPPGVRHVPSLLLTW